MHLTTDKQRNGLVCLALIIVTLAVFWQICTFEFTNTDDVLYITKNEHIASGLRWNNVFWVFTHGHAGNWHPLTGLSHILDCQLFGLNPGRHHLVNLLFHIGNTLLLFTVLRRMTGAFWPSAFVAALFAIHPLHVESIAWIAERKDVLSTMFWFLTIAAYFRYVKKPGLSSYILTLILFALGLMSKPMLVTLPFVLLLLDYWPLNRLEFNDSRQIYSLVWEKIPFLVLSAISSVVAFLVQKSAGAVAAIGAVPLTIRMANAVISYVKYIKKMIWPTNLAMFYPYRQSDMAIWPVLFAIVVLLLITILIIRLGKNYKYLPVGWFWYLGTLVPVIGLVQIGDQSMADRYTYVPLIGLFIIIAWGANDLLAEYRYRKVIFGVLSSAVMLVLSVCAWEQTGYWRNSLSLFEHAQKVTSENYVAHNNLGITLLAQNRFEEALYHFQRTIKIRPGYSDALINLGIVSGKLKRYEDEIKAYKQALEIDPNSGKAYSYLGAAYERTGRYQDEIEAYRMAIKNNPDYAEAYNNLSIAYGKLGRWQDATEMCRKAIKIRPDFAQSHNNLGVICGQLGRYKEALQAFEQAVKIKPGYAEAYNNLGITLDKLGRYQEAVEAYAHAVKNKLDYAEAYNKLGADLGRLGRYAKAIDVLNEAIRIDPANVEAYDNLGTTYSRLGRLQDAIQTFKQAIKIWPDDPRVHLGLGLVYLKAGDKDSAIKEYEILKTLDAGKAENLFALIKK